MKWFKHDSGAHNDEKMRELIHEFGCEGYGVYMVMLELVAEKLDEGLSPLIVISERVLREKCRVSHRKLVKILSFFDQKTLIYSKIIKRNWEISCPNMLNRLDNWTRKLSSHYEVPTKQVPSNQNQKENEKKKENPQTPIGQNGFFSEKDEKKIKEKIAEHHHHAVDSEANKLAFNNLVKGIIKDKSVKNPIAVALHRAAL